MFIKDEKSGGKSGVPLLFLLKMSIMSPVYSPVYSDWVFNGLRKKYDIDIIRFRRKGSDEVFIK